MTTLEQTQPISSYAVNYPIQTLVQKFDTKQILVPSFQRDFVWGKKFIQSFLRYVLKDFPVYNLLLVSDPNDPHKLTYILDGLQRLTSLQLFVNGSIHLGENREFSKAFFKDLPEEQQQRFLQKEIQVTKVEASKAIWPQLFLSVNSGSVPPNAAEKRRAKYDLPLLFELKRIATQNEEWVAIFGKNTRQKGLQILARAIAMHHYYDNYQKPLDTFIDNFCIMQESPDFAIEVDPLLDKLQIAISALYQHPKLGKNAFRLDSSKPVNLGMVDVMIHAALLLLEHDADLTGLSTRLNNLHAKVVKDNAMVLALTLDTSGVESVRSRMSLVEEYIKVSK